VSGRQPAQATLPGVTGPPLTVGTGAGGAADAEAPLDAVGSDALAPEDGTLLPVLLPVPVPAAPGLTNADPHPAASTPAAARTAAAPQAVRPSRVTALIGVII
jgi:hypothetical protein